MHTLKEMLAHFAQAVQHTHEAAVESLYKLGHSTGAQEVKEKIIAGDEGIRDELDKLWDEKHPRTSPPTSEQVAELHATTDTTKGETGEDKTSDQERADGKEVADPKAPQEGSGTGEGELGQANAPGQGPAGLDVAATG